MRAGSGRLRNRIGLLLLALPSVAFAQALPDASAAGAVFQRMQQLCVADDGKAWGVSLCGPVLLVDPASRQFVASMDWNATARCSAAACPTACRSPIPPWAGTGAPGPC